MTEPSLALLNCSFSVVYMSRASPDNGADLFDKDLTVALKLVLNFFFKTLK